MSTPFNYDEKNEKLEKLLDLLSTNISTQEDCEKVIDLFDAYHKSKIRHSYSFVTSYVLERDKKDGSFSEQFQLIAANLSMVLDVIKGDARYADGDLLKFIYKLMDHANLELTRLGYFERKFFQLHKLNKELSENYKKTSNELTTVNQSINSQRNQYITILGIFASIVITVFAGLSISSSIITSVHNSAVAKLCFFSCLTGFIVFNILVALFCFLTKINNIGLGNKYWILVIVFNIFMIIGAFGSIWAAFSVPVSDIGFSFFFKSTP